MPTREKVAELAERDYKSEYRIPIRLVLGLEKRAPEGEWAPMGLY